MRYFVGDVPKQPIVIVPERDGTPIDLSTVQFAIIYVDGIALNSSIVGGAVQGAWLPGTPFAEEGLYPVKLTLQYTGGGFETFEAEPVVAEDGSTGWHTIVTARGSWSNQLEDVPFYELLSIARTQIETYAPELLDDELPPLRYRQAQLMQARNILNSAKSDPSQSDDGSYFLLRPYPLDNVIKQLLRPKRGVPVVG